MFLRGSDPDKSRRQFTRRAALIGGLQAAGFSLLAARLYQLQVMDGRLYAPLADENRITVQAIAPLRGRIFDRAGRLLSDNIETFQVQVIPALAGKLSSVLDALAQLHPLSEQTRADVIARSRRQSKSLPIIVADGLDWQTTARINMHAALLPGVVTVIAGQRRYRGGVAMGHVVGYVGPVERFALDDPPLLRLPGARIGKAGVEAGLDAHLRGAAGAVKREVDARGHVVRELGRREPRHGGDVVLTLDTSLQDTVRARLKPFRRAAAAVVDTRSGQVACLISEPGYDPTPLFEGISQRQWKRLVDARDDPLIDRATQGQYPPGSTFKMVTALAALEHGAVTADDKFTCAGKVELAGHSFRCWNRSGHGPCNLHRAIKESCDVYFYEIAQRVGATKIAEMGRRLGLGQTYGLGLPAQKPGLLPDPDWKRGVQGKSWYDGETLLTGIGQGYVLATPLQLAVMTARLATGRAVMPTLAVPIADDDRTAATPAALSIGAAHLRAVRRAMRAVVNEAGGTGHRAAVSFGGFVMVGKTGTSQVTRLSGLRDQSALAWHHRDHALFVGYVSDADGPRYAGAVVIEHGGSGGKVAAPVLRDILEDVLAFDPSAKPLFRPGRRDA
ncbi:MAG: penicillin-binding protein 2 [Hyphomicrobiaceae bacterium]|nr:penicillin-binding protein 2 [Hyphomicrobiaceae bacterium]